MYHNAKNMPNNHPNEDLHEATPVNNGELCNLVSAEGDILNPGASCSNTFRNNPSPQLDQEEQSKIVDTVHLQLHCGSSRDNASRAVNEDINLALEKTSGGCIRKKLLVLDVNGLLLDISSVVPYDYDPDAIISKKAVFKRPYCDDFLKFCFERFNVGVWSSRNKRNVESVLDFLLGNDKCKLLFCWDQSHCTYTDFNTIENREKPLLLKKLKKLWEKRVPDLPWERGEYNESNTLLLDDSPYKAICNPPYTAIFPYTYRFRDRRDKSLGPGGDLRVYLEGLALADDVQEYVKQNPFGQRPITERNLSWRFYLRVIEANSSPPPDTGDDG
ncbi:uncharacterized protein LOC111372385 isoform X1 [Olea europaea var. sylvestris]|uniref:uncharacterized protein LOC111372385 isoform X1 n=2 Tax=Olea europaea var. sylvestris TaxID=158386 RepID=UPI000C1D846D|nr:uncharacterized protein LOC111372385 isoform X1 [Olea europaea var. sylvestris]